MTEINELSISMLVVFKCNAGFKKICFIQYNCYNLLYFCYPICIKVQSLHHHLNDRFHNGIFLNLRLFNESAFFVLQLYHNSYLPCGEIHQHVIQMSVSKANNVTYHRHDCSGSSITLSHLPPFCCTGTRTPQLSENIITIMNTQSMTITKRYFISYSRSHE